MPEITGIAHVELSVRDLDTSVAWYTQLLGARDVWRGSNAKYGITACAIYEPKSKMVFAFTQHAEQETSGLDRKSTRLNSSHLVISYAVFCLKKKKKRKHTTSQMQKEHD